MHYLIKTNELTCIREVKKVPMRRICYTKYLAARVATISEIYIQDGIRQIERSLYLTRLNSTLHSNVQGALRLDCFDERVMIWSRN
jgi:hypothetical protein